MKRGILAILFLLCALVTACGKGNKTTEKEPVSSEESYVCAAFLRQSFLTERFALYHDSDFQLRYFDTESGTDIVFCFDPSCDHEPEKRSRTGELLQKGCVSYSFSSYPVMIRGEYCFFFDQETGEVIRSDRQGENRKVIGKIPQYILPYSVFFSGDTIFVTYANSYEMIETKDNNGETLWIVGDAKPKRSCGIVQINLESGAYAEILDTEDYAAVIEQYDIRGDHLYFTRAYYDIPYISPNLETADPSLIPEGMTVENYYEELPKHAWMDVYDYTISTGELRVVLQNLHYGTTELCRDFFAVEEGNVTGLYRYRGERFRELDFPMKKGIRSDSGLVCRKGSDTVLIDENTGEIVKTSTVPGDTFVVEDILGNSCYGFLKAGDGWTPGYLSAEDFWNSNTANVVAFNRAESGVLEGTPTPSAETTPTPSAEATPTPTPTITPVDDDPTPHVVWAVHFSSYISEEAQAEVQRRLKEKGIDCRIDFLPVLYLAGDEYTDWLAKQKEENTVPDILPSSVWRDGILGAAEFSESELYPLNDFLNSGDGRALREAYTDVDWNRTTIHGKIYTVPGRVANLNEVYLYVNDRYRDDFENAFDGSYDSLRELCRSYSGDGPVIVAENFSSRILSAFLGCNSALFNASYAPQTKEFIPLTNQRKTEELLRTVYSDLQDGSILRIIFDPEEPEEPRNIPDNTLVYIRNTRIDVPEGFSEVVLMPELFKAALGASYGVSADSHRKDLAMQVLAACYSDPEIASLLCWRAVNAEGWKERTDYMNSRSEESLAGFFPEISRSQYLALKQYDEDLSSLCTKMFLERNGRLDGINQNYPEYLENFFHDAEDYGDAFEELNRQYKAWLTDRK